jgi:hypothetical protein
MNAPSLQQIIKTLEAKKYKVFDNESKPYNLNLVGLRTADKTPNVFNDWEYIFWKYAGSWEVIKFKITTDPGLYYLKNPLSELGTAILKPGQHLNLWSPGLHNGKYQALRQVSPCTVIRDFNRDNYLDYNSGREEKGLFGINNHRAVENGRSIMVDKWSAGCQVFEDYYQYEIFMRLVSEAVKNWTPAFTYTLITEAELVL